ncbi:porphobilinogen deaminase [Myotisia sp. PD_48]|nr:porphobilinogen deaminase [Myotisia sp. PD_48]
MEATPRKSFVIGTRKSNLAMLQTHLVRDALQSKWPDCEFRVLSRDAAGDLNKITPLREFTSKNLWTEELEQLLIAKEIDLVVHSLKDVPTQIPTTCALGPMMKREDPRDALVIKQGVDATTLADLPAGSVVGTSSVRRTAQLNRHYPHLKVVDIRGNIETRLAKLDAADGPFTCIILAAAGLLRSGYDARISQYLDSTNGKMFHAVGQGALGIEIRSDDEHMAQMLHDIGDKKTTFACLAERSLLRTLEGGCSAPLGVETEWIQGDQGNEFLRLRSIVTSVDGKEAVELSKDLEVTSPAEAEAFGISFAKEMASNGAAEILEAIQQKKKLWLLGTNLDPSKISKAHIGARRFTTRTIQQAFEKYVMQQIREHGTAPLFITIFLGANDACLMQNGTIVPLEEYEDRIREYVNTILNDPATEETKVILISPPPVDVPPPEAASVSRSTAALGRGHQTWLSKRIFAKTIVKIGKEFEAKSDRVATLDFWTIVTKQACHQIYRSFDELDIEGLLPGSGLPGTMEFGKTYFVDRLHMGITAYSLLGNKLMELIANKWPELK